EQSRRMNQNAIADDGGLARMGDARRNQVQNEFMIDFATANDDGVAGVMAALIASDDVEMWREQVNDLAFAFISPLRADDCEVHVCVVFAVRRPERNQLITMIRIVMFLDFEVALD